METYTLARFGLARGEGSLCSVKATKLNENSLDATHSVYVVSGTGKSYLKEGVEKKAIL